MWYACYTHKVRSSIMFTNPLRHWWDSCRAQNTERSRTFRSGDVGFWVSSLIFHRPAVASNINKGCSVLVYLNDDVLVPAQPFLLIAGTALWTMVSWYLSFVSHAHRFCDLGSSWAINTGSLCFNCFDQGNHSNLSIKYTFAIWSKVGAKCRQAGAHNNITSTMLSLFWQVLFCNSLPGTIYQQRCCSEIKNHFSSTCSDW